MLDTLEKKEIKLRPCPSCRLPSKYFYKIQEGESDRHAVWFRCVCGVIHQQECPDGKIYDKKYVENMLKIKEGKSRLVHSSRIYAPLIEELTLGRMMLDVGFCVENNMEFFKDRGWITWGIDINSDATQGNHYCGDFSTFDFDIKANTDDLKALADGDKFKRYFDMIWMGDYIGRVSDPIAAINKAYDCLSEDGVLFISTPDNDFINQTSLPGFAHFKSKEYYTIWNTHSLKTVLEKAGFNVIMARRNYSSRFHTWHDVHIIAQKNYF